MKALLIPLTLALVLLPAISHFQEQLPIDATFTLTASEVTTAKDIEKAIKRATKDGNQLGIVILDGRQGEFVYSPQTDAYNLIHIKYARVTLRGANQAKIALSRGIQLASEANHIVIENLIMSCIESCIYSTAGNHDVEVRGSQMESPRNGIYVENSERWTISENQIQAGIAGIYLVESANARVSRNIIRANFPLALQHSTGCQISENEIYGQWQGMVLEEKSSRNEVTNNQINNVQSSGITLEENVFDNRIESNQVKCTQDANCTPVDAPGKSKEKNRIGGNTKP